MRVQHCWWGHTILHIHQSRQIRLKSQHGTRQIINPAEHLSYQMPEKPFEVFEEDFIKTMLDYEMYVQGIDSKEFNDKLLQRVLYSSTVSESENVTTLVLKGGK